MNVCKANSDTTILITWAEHRKTKMKGGKFCLQMVVARFMVPYPLRPFKSGNLFCNTEDFWGRNYCSVNIGTIQHVVLNAKNSLPAVLQTSMCFFPEKIAFTIFLPQEKTQHAPTCLGKLL